VGSPHQHLELLDGADDTEVPRHDVAGLLLTGRDVGRQDRRELAQVLEDQDVGSIDVIDES
jgi:hypothetical protein